MDSTWSGTNKNVDVYNDDGTVSRSNSSKPRRKAKSWVYTGNYGMVCYSGFYNIGPRCKWYAKTKSKKRRGSKYQSYRVNGLGVGMSGDRYDVDQDGDCDSTSEPYSLSKQRRRSSISVQRNDWHDASRWYSCGHVGGHSSPKIANSTVFSTCPTW